MSKEAEDLKKEIWSYGLRIEDAAALAGMTLGNFNYFLRKPEADLEFIQNIRQVLQR